MSHQLTLKISLAEEIRRIQIQSEITFEQLEKLVRKLFGKIANDEHLLFKYIDDEGDSITVSSNEELSEAMSSQKESSLLRFYLSSSKNKNFEEKPTNENLHGHQWHSLHNQAMKLFESGNKDNLEEAKEILKTQTEMSSEHHKKIPLYNLACAESLLGNHDSALSYLQNAINHGFKNLKHILNDEDLKNLRELDGFKEILVSLEKSGNLDDALNFLEKAISEGYRNFEDVQSDADLNNLRGLDRFTFLNDSLFPKESCKLREIFSNFQNEVIQNFPKEKKDSEVESHLLKTQHSEKENFSENEFEKEISLLTNMGWMDRKKNISALFNAKGDIVLAIELLLAEN